MKPEHLERCQVATPEDVVPLVWEIASKQRDSRVFPSVLDLGAGDARFASVVGCYKRYVGIEKDPAKAAQATLPLGAKLILGDALDWSERGYDLCIGNPPYIRHHHLEPIWRDQVLTRIHAECGIKIKKTANLFVIFLTQAILLTKNDGLVVQVVPFEWVSRPSSSELRDYIKEKKWNVTVLRFTSNIFPRVLTTASITIIDKSRCDGQWSFGEIERSGSIKLNKHASGGSSSVLPYSDRNAKAHALRGLSPGGQEIFVLTEEERLRFSLQKKRDVIPCVTSLRRISQSDQQLDRPTFERAFVNTGARCWLIRSDRIKRSAELERYLSSVGNKWQQYSTCTTRKDWALFRLHPVPDLLFASGFTGKTPKIVVNSIGAIAVGSVYGVISDSREILPNELQRRLLEYDFRRRVVSHANNLRKVEVRQLNSVLDHLF